MFGLPKHPLYQLMYLYGFPEYTIERPVLVKVEETSLDFYFNKGFKYRKISIPAADVLELELDAEVNRSAGKAAAGAIIGGVLTGGIGLLAGAVIGGRQRKQNELKLAVRYEEKNCIIAFKSSYKIPKICAEIRQLIS